MPRILNEHLPTNAVEYSINSKFGTSGGNFIDLFITHNTYSPFVAHPSIIYGGKADKAATWDNILTQVFGYAQTFVKTNGKFIYMVGAMGSGCRFFRYKMGDTTPTTSMEYEPKKRLTLFVDTSRATTYDISTDFGQTAVAYFIDYIIANPTPL